MLTVTADDYGKTRHATDSIIKCFCHKRITSASAMVFMEDSDRAAALSLQTGIEVGLHLNFTQPFSAPNMDIKLREHQNRVASYLLRYKLSQAIYNPLLMNSFHFLFLAQQEEFLRLYGKFPDFYNGHHHMHLCANVLLSRMIPMGARVRRTFTFERGERGSFNRLYRHILDIFISDQYVTGDCFFSILPIQNHERLQKIVNRAVSEKVEIEVHPENSEEMEFLFSNKYENLMGQLYKGGFRELRKV